MKKQFFSFVMMLALVIVTGSAFAQAGSKFAPYPGGTYTYNIPYTLTHAGNVALTLAGAEMTLGTTTPSGLTSGGAAVSLGLGSGTIALPITFAANATGSKTISIVITDLTSNCSNNIHLDVTMQAVPTLVLGITGVPDICQALKASPNSNEDASVGAPANTFIYTVTPVITAAGSPTYDFSINLADYGFGSSTIIHTSGAGTPTPATAVSSGSIAVTGATGVQTFTVTFATTEGAGADITGQISGAKLNMEAANGGQIYDGTYSPNNDVVTVKALPTIGVFQ